MRILAEYRSNFQGMPHLVLCLLGGWGTPGGGWLGQPEPRLGKLRGRHIPEGAVRPDLVVVEAPGLDLAPSILERQKPMGIQALVAEATTGRTPVRAVLRRNVDQVTGRD